jgi:hypothetical protein
MPTAQARQPGIDWPAVTKKVASHAWAAAIVDSLAAAFDRFTAAWPGDPPTETSEWTHHYYCDDDAHRLRFDINKPREHVCPTCSRIYSGHPWDGAWRTLVHGSIITNTERAAILARLRPHEPKYAAFLRRIVLFYAEHYRDYPIHGVRAGKGKIMPQCLDESILLLNLSRYIEWGRGQRWLSESEHNVVRERLFRPAVDLIRPQVDTIHNIHAWMMSALGACAYQLDDRDLLGWTLDSPFGFHQQLARGANEDGFWFEGSITYHFYSFNALVSHALTALDAGIDLFDAPRLSRMLTAPLGLVYPTGAFPAHNDGWPGVRLSPYLYELATWAWPGDASTTDLARVLRIARSTQSVAAWTQTTNQFPPPPTGHPRASVHALLWGPPDIEADPAPLPRVSRLFPASGIAILESTRSDLRLCLRAGPYGGGHDHLDKLNIDVFANGDIISPDLGTSGYGAKISMQWHKTPAAHNIVVIDGTRQRGSAGEVVSHSHREIVARADAAHPGVRLQRRVSLTDTGWRDTFTVTADAARQADYFFHAIGTLTLDRETAPASLGEGVGYAWPRDVRAIDADEDVLATWTGPAGTLTARIEGAAGTRIFTAIADDNPAHPQRPLGVLVLRRTGIQETTFTVEYSFQPKERRP